MDSHLYFDASKMPSPGGRYVLWCDGMGTGRSFSRSLATAANYVYKLQLAFARAVRDKEDVRAYPLMDGCYVTARKRADICAVIQNAMCDLANEFVRAQGTDKMFMVRGAIAFGATIEGGDVPAEAFHRSDREHLGDEAIASMKKVLLSPAMVLAFNAEKLAPPFGLYVDDSAQAIPQLADPTDFGFNSRLWQWWRGLEGGSELAKSLFGQISFYLNKCEVHSTSKGYPKERIAAHRELAIEYFGGLVERGG